MQTIFFILQLISFTSAWTTTSPRPSFERAAASIHDRRSFALPATQLDYHPSDLLPDVTSTWEIPAWLKRLQRHTSNKHSKLNKPNADEHHEMPWTKTFRQDKQKLTYMPFRNWQMEFMQENLTNLRQLPVTSKTGRDMSFKKTDTHRIHTACYESEEYKLIRLTSLDAGKQTQVFTSLWYPRDSLMPVLGIDLLQFGQKTLCIIDFQPITVDQPDQQAAIEQKMAEIRNQFPSLQSQMTDRFYSASDAFFSKQMLLGRHDASVTDYTADKLVNRDLFPAFQQYVTLHTKLMKQSERCQHDLHQSYDTYSAARDPAHHLLAKIFGQEWADEYVYDILFPEAQKA